MSAVYVVLEHFASMNYIVYAGNDMIMAKKAWEKEPNNSYKRSLQIWDNGKRIYDNNCMDCGARLPWDRSATR